MYSPRSESNLGFTSEEDYRHGIGDPEAMEQYRDEREAEQERNTVTDDLPHLQLGVPEPPMMEQPPMMGEEEEPIMDDENENARGAEISQMTGMPDMGNLSIGNATGTMPAPGGMLTTGEPMDDAWSTLLKFEESAGPPPMKEGETMNEYMQRIAGPFGALPMPSREIDAAPYVQKPQQRNFDEAWQEENKGEPMDAAWSSLMKQRLPHITWLTPDKTAGWINGHINIRADLWAGNNPGGYTESISDTYYDAPTLVEDYWEEDDAGIERPPPPTEQSQFEQTMFDEEGNLKSEPISDAWSSLMKARLDRFTGAKDKSWKQPEYEIAAGGSQQETPTPRRAKLHSRYVEHSKKHGLEHNPWSVHRSHRGIAVKQPLRLFPQAYGQQMGTQTRRKLMGNVPQVPAGHAMGPETTYAPRTPRVAASQGLPISAPRAPAMRGAGFAKSEDLLEIKKDIEEIQKKHDYMQFAQIRRLLRRLKDVAERQERRLKAAVSGGHGKNREAGHREGHKTTKPEGATENLKDDPKNWGAPSTIFAARGSGRVG